MRYRVYLILLLCSAAFTNPALAQETRYRVEILVLTLVEHTEEPREMPFLADYSAALDFLTPPIEKEADAENPAEMTVAETVADSISLSEPGAEGEEVLPEEDPNQVTHVEEMSAVMQEAWRRLRLSGPYRPEQYLSWEQGDQDPFPALRVHDLEVVRIDDPWADRRAELLAQAADQAGIDDVNAGSPTVFADAAGLNALQPDNDPVEPALPDPVYFYRLDGTATLIRTRFLHLDLDLQLREALWAGGVPASPAIEGADMPAPPPSSYRVYTLKQSRQIRTGRMEYFDGPVLGVLAYMTEVAAGGEETP